MAPQWGGAMVVPADDLSSAVQLVVQGVHDLSLTNFIIKHVQPGFRIVDAGANLGYFTVLFAYQAGPAGRVYAYEPNPKLASFLQVNLALYNVKDRVVFSDKAIHSERGRRPFFVTERFWGSSSLHEHDELFHRKFADEVNPVEVETMPLDDLLTICDHFDLIKIDVEGGEYQAFLGMNEILRQRAADLVIFELNRLMLQSDWEPFRAYLTDLVSSRGVGCYTLSPEGEMIEADFAGLWEQDLVEDILLRFN